MSLLYSLDFDVYYNPGDHLGLYNFTDHDGNIIVDYVRYYGHQAFKIRCIISNIKYKKVKSVRGGFVEYGTINITFQDRLKMIEGSHYLPDLKKNNFCELCKYEIFDHKFCKYKNLENIPYKIFEGNYRSPFYGHLQSYLVSFPKGFLPWHFTDKYTTFVDLFDVKDCRLQDWEFYTNCIFMASSKDKPMKKYITGDSMVSRKNSQLKASWGCIRYSDTKEREYRNKNRELYGYVIGHIDPINWPRAWSYFSEILSDHKVVHDIRVSNNYDLWI
jgi:hypothetical protein